MRTPREMYAQYNIMPNLQLHQLRVAAVGKLICDAFSQPINAGQVITACLFHDMGNIIKSELAYFPDFCEPEGLDYWNQVKKQFLEKYGSDHHKATEVIIEEIGLPKRVIELINGVGYSKIASTVAGDDIEQKICEYADMRVGPRGILPLKERLAEGRTRYLKTRNTRPHYDTDDGFEKLSEAAALIEEQVFALSKITPADVNDAVVQPHIEELRDYPVA